MTGALELNHDLQTTPLQFTKNYHFEAGSTSKVEIVLRNENDDDIIGTVRIIFRDPPEYRIVHCVDQKGFLSNIPKEPNKIWEIRRIKDDSNNKIVIHYDGELVADDKVTDSCTSWGDEVKILKFHATSAPDFYRAKPAPGKKLNFSLSALLFSPRSLNMPFLSNWSKVV